MKPIKWRKRGVIKVANVEGVRLRLLPCEGGRSFFLVEDRGYDKNRADVEVVVRGANRRAIDAAAYALADLCATLAGES